jgi:hypothetical protein
VRSPLSSDRRGLRSPLTVERKLYILFSLRGTALSASLLTHIGNR